MTREQFDEIYNDNYDLQDLHADYIMRNCHGDRVICDGDTLILALEDGYLYEDFRDDYLQKHG